MRMFSPNRAMSAPVGNFAAAEFLNGFLVESGIDLAERDQPVLAASRRSCRVP